jgi:hypothetical protein
MENWFDMQALIAGVFSLAPFPEARSAAVTRSASAAVKRTKFGGDRSAYPLSILFASSILVHVRP